MAIWDFDTINEVVPIEEVLALHGISPAPPRGRGEGWYSIRPDDDTPSAHIDARRRYGNTIYDFGYHNTFNPLTLTMYLQGVDIVEASRILGEAFHVPPKYEDKETSSSGPKVTDYEWRLLGIYPDMVSKNMDFLPEKFGVTNTMKLSEQYMMPMTEFYEQVTNPDATKADTSDLRRYENILRNKAVPYAYEKRDEYFRRMYDDFELAKAVNSDADIDKIFALHKSDYEKLAKELSSIELTMKKVLAGTSVKFRSRRYNPVADFVSVVNGEVSFEIGLNSHYEVSGTAYRDKTKIFYCIVTLNEYYSLMANGMDNVQVAARRKGEQVSLSFSSTNSDKVNYLIKALRGKEAVLSESLGQALNSASFESKDIAPARNVSQMVTK